jgi:solute carrier family 50 protein (sugar transporter)
MNCIAWMIYGIQLGDYYIFTANVFGLVVGVFYSITALELMSQSRSESDLNNILWLEMLLVGGVLFYGIMGLIVGLALDSSQKEAGEMIFASSGNFFALFYYAAPLTTIAEVFRTRDSSSLYPPMLLANTCNSSMWFVYGLFGIYDPFVYVPNGIGASLSIFQLFLAVTFKRKEKEEEEDLSLSLAKSSLASHSHHPRA